MVELTKVGPFSRLKLRLLQKCLRGTHRLLLGGKVVGGKASLLRQQLVVLGSAMLHLCLLKAFVCGIT